MSRLDRTRTSAHQLRPFFSSQNLLNRADGSAQFDFGESSVMCSVVGPAEVKLRDEKLDKATIEVVVRPLVGLPGIKDKAREQAIRETLEPLILSGLHPRTGIQIVIQTMKDDGSILATAFNATILALLDAGIPLKSILGAVTCIVDAETNQILLDPTTQELANAKSTHTFVFDNKSSITSDSKQEDKEAVEVATLYSDSTGLFSEEEYFECAQICYKAVQAVHGFIRTAVQKKLEKEQQQIHS
ncbi:ribosomal protein S5 domain 2-type protein [Linnemannia elongata]|uniref:Ribosomal protein S5 domain 2-like protein n=1 Tax=Linnemannia elongata AG-77 TaxID=1314771 RepID=A0A197K3Q2_9FUNG|nr:Exosome component 5 [Linnemannia elongata]KAF9316402.1 Exosome component 5 [Linnemannia elongata]KAG0059696.1 Exosome component 5 [Linnemannia elongata]KAH7042426.1 ribosomal protein S5 domain 2-type protein [Linnemannia elongata]OAQ31818.1 ribosomal protein S5 domain 2-like protein [Linnemannia elongata AG-77]